MAILGADMLPGMMRNMLESAELAYILARQPAVSAHISPVKYDERFTQDPAKQG